MAAYAMDPDHVTDLVQRTSPLWNGRPRNRVHGLPDRLHCAVPGSRSLAYHLRSQGVWSGERFIQFTAEGPFEIGGFLVMADPEGNEFCLVHRHADPIR